jgi:DNA-binding LytR/AlgR family response regulator
MKLILNDCQSVDYIRVGSRKKFTANQIVLVEANINYSMIHLSSGKSVLTATTLKEIEKRCLSAKRFFRVNRQQLINFDFVIKQTEEEVFLPNNICCKVSRRKKNLLKSRTF